MPMFPEGQDPLDPSPMRAPMGVALPDPFAGPTMGDTIGAAFRQNNPVVSVINALGQADPTREVDPSHNPMSLIRGTKYEADHIDSFISSPNEATTRALMSKIDAETADRATLQASGTAGTVASIAAGLLDPTFYIPIVGEAAGARAAGGVLATAGRMAATGALQAGASEMVLQGSQAARPGSESTMNIATNTLLMGLLGTVAAKYFTPQERVAAEAAFEKDRVSISGADPAAPSFGMQPQAVGAAAADARTVEGLTPKGYVLDKLPVVGEWFKNASPTQRIFWQDVSVSAKRAVADMAETPLRMDMNTQGIATATDVPISRMVQTEKSRYFIGATDTLRDSFKEYRYGDQAPSMAHARAAISDFRGQADGKMSYSQFKEEVSKALYSGDVHEIPQVQREAQSMRANVLEVIKKRAVDSGQFDMDAVAPKGDRSFFPRIWNKKAVVENRHGFKEKITQWLSGEQADKAATKDRLTALVEQHSAATSDHEASQILGKMEDEARAWKGNSADEAIAAIKERDKAEAARGEKQAAGEYKGKGERLTGADSAVSRAVKRMIESDQDLTHGELASRADEIIDRILGSPDGRLPYDIASGGPRIGAVGNEPLPRGSLQSRDFAIPTASVADFVEHDVEHVLQSFLRTMLPDLALHERFGDVELKDVFRRINEEFSARASKIAAEMEAGGEAKLKSDLNALEKTRLGTIRDVAAMRDKIRNVYGYSADTGAQNLARAARAARNFTSMTDLGTSSLNSMADLAGVVFRYGFGAAFNDAWKPYFQGMLRMGKLAGRSKQQARDMMISIETDTNLRGHQLNDIVDGYKPGSKFERGLQYGADKMQLVNGQSWYTDRAKSMALSVAQAEMLRSAERISGGKPNKRDVEWLASNSIDPGMATRIWEQFKNGGGETIDGTHLANTKDWADRQAARMFEGALQREVDIAVVTPGMEKPLWMSNPIWGVFGQFKAFVAATHERTLVAQFQQRDARTLQGVIASVAMGMLSYRLYTAVAGQEVSDKPQDWIKEGISRSGITGWLDEANSVAAKATSGMGDMYRLVGADKPLSKYASRSAMAGLLGPAYSKGEAVFGAAGSLSSGEWSASDTSRVRRLIPFQNLFYLRNLLNKVEGGVNDAFGVPAKPPQ